MWAGHVARMGETNSCNYSDCKTWRESPHVRQIRWWKGKTNIKTNLIEMCKVGWTGSGNGSMQFPLNTGLKSGFPCRELLMENNKMEFVSVTFYVICTSDIQTDQQGFVKQFENLKIPCALQFATSLLRRRGLPSHRVTSNQNINNASQHPP